MCVLVCTKVDDDCCGSVTSSHHSVQSLIFEENHPPECEEGISSGTTASKLTFYWSYRHESPNCPRFLARRRANGEHDDDDDDHGLCRADTTKYDCCSARIDDRFANDSTGVQGQEERFSTGVTIEPSRGCVGCPRQVLVQKVSTTSV